VSIASLLIRHRILVKPVRFDYKEELHL